MSKEEALELAEGEPSERDHLDPNEVRDQAIQAILQAKELLELVYDLTYLEAKLHCDTYHDGKKSFSDLGETYGYINSYVRRENGSNTLRFQYRRPTVTGSLIRENIRMPANGYTEASFKRSAHEFETELAVMTEESYSRLRRRGKNVRTVIRKLRSVANVEITETDDEE